MAIEPKNKTSNTLKLNGIIYKTSGNIVFQDPENNKYIHAESKLAEDMDDFIQNGMQAFLKKIKS